HTRWPRDWSSDVCSSDLEAERAVNALLAEKVEAIAVCLINSFANPAHELLLKDIIARKAPHLPLSISYEVLPEIKEYERTSTTRSEERRVGKECRPRRAP